MKTYSDQCFRCRFFDRYYVRGDDKFERTKFGYCQKQRKNTDIHGCCGSYVYMPRPRSRCDFLIDARLDRILTELTVLRELIEEDEREKNL